MAPFEIKFLDGLLIVNQCPEDFKKAFPQITWDPRQGIWVLPAYYYRDVVLWLRAQKYPYQDLAKKFEPLALPLKEKITLRPHQEEGFRAWKNSSGKGMILFPTGAGKTIMAMVIISHQQRPTLIHVPTKTLLHQWYEELTHFFSIPIGIVGDSEYKIEPITVITYDSAMIHLEKLGNLFGLLIFDECHHLPGDRLKMAAVGSMAPFRLGLTATLERQDGKEALMESFVGPILTRVEITELEGETLAPYEVISVRVELTEEERTEYLEQRQVYKDFLSKYRIAMQGPQDWSLFIKACAKYPEGRGALAAFYKQKKISQSSEAKSKELEHLLKKHSSDRILIFTNDNDTAYRIGREFLLPVITHHTKNQERTDFLNKFRTGEYPILVTSKVLNEGYNVPEANVGVIFSGNATVREHVQRLGRILRAKPGKTAFLYELITAGTTEESTSFRRRQHNAYQRYHTPHPTQRTNLSKVPQG